MKRRAFIELVATAPLVAALKPWQPEPTAWPIAGRFVGYEIVDGVRWDKWVFDVPPDAFASPG